MNSSNPFMSFDDEEMYWPEIPADKEALLSASGMFRFKDIKHLLKVKSHQLTKESNKAKEAGISTYEAYGFGKPHGGQYIVRMSKFSRFYQEHLLPMLEGRSFDVMKMPETVTNANQLTSLDGVYYLQDLCKHSPFSTLKEIIQNHARETQTLWEEGEREEDAKQTCGCWFDTKKRVFLVQLPKFLEYFFETIWVGQPHRISEKKPKKESR